MKEVEVVMRRMRKKISNPLKFLVFKEKIKIDVYDISSFLLEVI
tara:strand:+ start:141 stop:272 length:132 start_codon:yes stop_codon:yes gene_type:complete